MIEDPQGRRAERPTPNDPEGVSGGDGHAAADTDLDEADRALVEELRAVATLRDPVPDETILAARSTLAYLRLDAALAELTFDSLTDAAPVAVRSHAVAARQLSFDAGEFQVELEVVREEGRCRLVGQCVPATEVEITVYRQDAVTESRLVATITTDDLGRFGIEVAPGMVSLLCRWPSSDVTVATAWVAV